MRCSHRTGGAFENRQRDSVHFTSLQEPASSLSVPDSLFYSVVSNTPLVRSGRHDAPCMILYVIRADINGWFQRNPCWFIQARHTILICDSSRHKWMILPSDDAQVKSLCARAAAKMAGNTPEKTAGNTPSLSPGHGGGETGFEHRYRSSVFTPTTRPARKNWPKLFFLGSSHELLRYRTLEKVESVLNQGSRILSSPRCQTTSRRHTAASSIGRFPFGNFRRGARALARRHALSGQRSMV